MKTFKFIPVLLFIATFSLMSCNRDDEPANNNFRSAKDDATAENMFDDVLKQASDGMLLAEDSTAGNKDMYSPLAGGCATVSIAPFDLTTFPKTITIDFGSTNCLGNDGRNRRGVIQVVTTGWYRDSATSITVTPQNYFVDDNQVQGSKTITNLGHNAAGNLHYGIEVSGSVTTTEGIITWTSDRDREWIEGESTVFNPWDDVYLITGTASGTNVQGEAFTVIILAPLRIQFGCRWIEAGSLKIVSNGTEIVVDYGSGACDATATVTINGNTYTISMM